MRRRIVSVRGPAVLALVLLPIALGAEAQSPPDDATDPDDRRLVREKPHDEEASASRPSSPVPFTYRPPPRGAPTRRASGGTRDGSGAEGGLPPLHLTVLAPRATGLTTRASPTLYWFASRPIEQPVVVVVSTPAIADPLAQARFEAGVAAGIQSLSLADVGLELEVGTEYEWAVVVPVDPDDPSKDRVTIGGIRRVAPPETLPPEPTDLRDAQLAARYARSGIWYDALDALSVRVALDPDARQTRAWLLEQEGLLVAAAHDRRPAE